MQSAKMRQEGGMRSDSVMALHRNLTKHANTLSRIQGKTLNVKNMALRPATRRNVEKNLRTVIKAEKMTAYDTCCSKVT